MISGNHMDYGRTCPPRARARAHTHCCYVLLLGYFSVRYALQLSMENMKGEKVESKIGWLVMGKKQVMQCGFSHSVKGKNNKS